MDKNNSGYAPSFAWRSILSSQDIIHNGSRLRIGNGQQIKVFEDRWLPSNTGFKVRAHQRIISDDCRVMELIDEELGTWKRD